jgi:hypothetical protein
MQKVSNQALNEILISRRVKVFSGIDSQAEEYRKRKNKSK